VKFIDVTDYPVVAQTPEGEVVAPYQVRASLINLLFSQQNLGAMEILERDDIARKIRDSVADESGILSLEDAEFKMLETATKAFKGFGKNDVELVRRVLNASKT
jgi:hypothetical protein